MSLRVKTTLTFDIAHDGVEDVKAGLSTCIVRVLSMPAFKESLFIYTWGRNGIESRIPCLGADGRQQELATSCNWRPYAAA